MRIDNRTDTFSYDELRDAIDELDGCIMEADDGEGPCAADCDIDEHVERASLLELLDKVSDFDEIPDGWAWLDLIGKKVRLLCPVCAGHRECREGHREARKPGG